MTRTTLKNQVIMAIGTALLSVATKSMIDMYRRKRLMAERLQVREAYLDVALAESMDCSDATAKY